MRLLDRTLNILECVYANGGLGVYEISETLEVPTSTVYRILSSLPSRNYIRHSGPNCYEVGARLLTMQGIAERQNLLMPTPRRHLGRPRICPSCATRTHALPVLRSLTESSRSSTNTAPSNRPARSLAHSC